jgi:large subunit ribosomal protein L4
MNTAAIKSALSFKANNDEMLVVDKFELTAPKTREVAAVIKAFELKGKTLIVLTDDNADVVRAAANIPDVKTINASLINVYDLVASGKCVFTKEAVEKIEEAYAND